MRSVFFAAFLSLAASGYGQALGAARVTPNLVDNIDRPLRYRPDGLDFVIENGAETFNRPLYGGNTAFRVDGGDKPEFVLYLPGRGGNLRVGVRAANGTAKWLLDAAKITTRYRPGSLLYEIRDPLLGGDGVLRLTALAYHQTEGFVVRAEGEKIAVGVELIWAYGGMNGQRGTRDGDIGTERVPISQWFQLSPEFCADNTFEIAAETSTFTLRAKAATIFGVMPAGARLRIADAAHWGDPATLLTAENIAAPMQPVIAGRVALASGQPVLLSLQRLAVEGATASAQDLATYREVTADQPGVIRQPARLRLAPAFARDALPRLFDESERYFAALRTRVSVTTPDPFFNAAVASLNVAADAVWDEPDQAIMHGAIAWRTKLLGWRGPYSLDALGRHDRAQQHYIYWAGRQNTKPVPDALPPADENANLARNETGLHSNGDLSNSHYDMNIVYIDALFRHLRWTGDLEFAKKMWSVIERHLAWERRLFRREFGPEKLPLYEAYAVIWASDDLQYHGGGTMHASAYNYFHNQEAARLARLIGVDPVPYRTEALLLEQSMRALLWTGAQNTGDAAANGRRGPGYFAEFKDLLGLQRVHPSAALWTFYHTMDSEVPTAEEAWQMTRYVDTALPHLPIRGPGVPAGFHTVATTNWLPYHWSINNVVMAEAVHGALGFWQAGRADEAWKIMKGSLLAAMFMGISPGNVGSMSYLDVYRRESQRDFADGSGVLSRAIVEGVFGVKPDALAGELRVMPGWPAEWTEAALRHPDVRLSFKRAGNADAYVVEQSFAKPQALRLRLSAQRDRIASVTVNGAAARWHLIENAVGAPQLDVLGAAASKHEIVVTWAGERITSGAVRDDPRPSRRTQGEMRWLELPDAAAPPSASTSASTVAIPASTRLAVSRVARFEPVDLTSQFNDRVTQIFKNEYRAPRSPFVSLALPKQGVGGWAGGMNTTAEIDDAGLRSVAGQNDGRLMLPNGVLLRTPSENSAKNVVFTSQWDNYPREATIPLTGRAIGAVLLLAGSTNHMQSRFENGEIIATYSDGTSARLALENPTNWWPIEEDYFFDDFQFRIDPATRLPMRVDLKTGQVRELELSTFKGRGGKVAGGAATVLELTLDSQKELRSLTVRALANEVVIGLMAATLVR